MKQDESNKETYKDSFALGYRVVPVFMWQLVSASWFVLLRISKLAEVRSCRTLSRNN